MERRKVLALLVQGGSGLIALMVGIPTLIYAFSPLGRNRSERWRTLGPLDEFPLGEVHEATVQPSAEAAESSPPLEQGVYVWRRSSDEVVVFSRSCTDLGCPVTWDRGSHCFLCPCHGGIFDHEGKRMAGPPDRPLYRYDNRIRGGILEIDLSSVPPMA